MRCTTCHGTGHVLLVPQTQEISRCPDCRGLLSRWLMGATRSIALLGGRGALARHKTRPA